MSEHDDPAKKKESGPWRPDSAPSCLKMAEGETSAGNGELIRGAVTDLAGVGNPVQANLESLDCILMRVANAKKSARLLRSAATDKKNAALLELVRLLTVEEESILAANRSDLAALPADYAAAFRDRLTLTPERIEGMRESLRQVAALGDPVGEVVEKKTLKNGLLAQRVRSPLGVIFMIFESRPNVALEAFSLAMKAGNVILLRGGRESQATVGRFYALIARALKAAGLPDSLLVGITNPDRGIVTALLQRTDLIDVVVPRGGPSLIQAVVDQSKIPIIKNDRGMCHIYVHSDADLKMAVDVVQNAKVQRPGVCNAVETLLVHDSVADRLFPEIARAMPTVEIFAEAATLPLFRGAANVQPATADSFDTEYEALKLNARAVASLEEAIAHVERHGSRHSESILTANRENFEVFRDAVDAAAVYWNASTRFTDGFELGLGGELGISTQKLHVRGPVGLRELTSIRWVIEGTGQVRK